MRMISAAVLAFMALAVPVAPAVAGDATENALARRVIDGAILPAYEALEKATAAGSSDIGKLCATPSTEALATARQGFRATLTAWSRAEMIRFGPITEDSRLDRFLFWPDRKGIAQKQIQSLIADLQSEALDATTMAGKSVGVQGLGALEYTLFGTGSDDLASGAGAARCRIGAAIAGNLDAMAAGTLKGWQDPQGVAAALLHPGPDNASYRNDNEVQTEIFGVLVQGLELVRDVRINGFLGARVDADKPKQAIYWRAGATAESIAANLDGLRMVFDAAGYASALKPDDRLLAKSVDAQFANAQSALRGLDGPLADALADPPLRKRLAYVRIITSSLSHVIGVQISGALGLSAGFSSLDGD